MIIIPPVCILGGNYLSKITFKKNYKYIFIFILLISYFVNLLLNLSKEYIVHDISNYVSRFINFKWNFFFPLTGPSGPIFGVSFESIVFSLVMSFIFLVLCLIFSKKEKIFQVFITNSPFPVYRV